MYNYLDFNKLEKVDYLIENNNSNNNNNWSQWINKAVFYEGMIQY